jgi:hypothetical protein
LRVKNAVAVWALETAVHRRARKHGTLATAAKISQAATRRAQSKKSLL